MREQPVLWHEGMLVSPHHFQASERFQAENLQIHQRFDHPYGYGLLSLDLNTDALAAGQFEIVACQARLRDGTIISIGQQTGGPGAGLRRSVSKELQTLPESLVYLAIPKDREGWANVSPDHQGGDHRYAAINATIPDETNPEVSRPVTFRKLNIKLLLDTDDLSGYETLPIAKVTRGAEGLAINLDHQYVPPIVTIDAWKSLRTQMVQPILDLVNSRIKQISQPLTVSGVNLGSLQSADTSRIFLAMLLNGEYANLCHYVHGADNHPATVYRDLCRLAGSLAVFHPDRRLLEFTHYDHDNIGRVFAWVKYRIEVSLAGIPDISYEMRYFVAKGRSLSVEIEQSWLGYGWKWYVGVLRGKDLSSAACGKLLRELHWKVGSVSQVETLFQQNRPDVGLVLDDDPPGFLPKSEGWDFFTVDTNSPAWNDVAETQEIAMRLADREEIKTNDGVREVQIGTSSGKVPLQFAVFAVAPK